MIGARQPPAVVLVAARVAQGSGARESRSDGYLRHAEQLRSANGQVSAKEMGVVVETQATEETGTLFSSFGPGKDADQQNALRFLINRQLERFFFQCCRTVYKPLIRSRLKGETKNREFGTNH